MSIHAISGKTLDGAAPGANVELVQFLRAALKDAESGTLQAFAGVLGRVSDKGKLDYRIASFTNDWPHHDRLTARVGALHTFMQNELLDDMCEADEWKTPGDKPA